MNRVHAYTNARVLKVIKFCDVGQLLSVFQMKVLEEEVMPNKLELFQLKEGNNVKVYVRSREREREREPESERMSDRAREGNKQGDFGI